MDSKNFFNEEGEGNSAGYEKEKYNTENTL